MTSNPLTSSAGDTPASRSVSPELDEGPMIPDISGLLSPTYFAFYDPDGHCWRMSQATFPLDSMKSLPTWPRSGMTRNGRAYQQPQLVRLTSDGDSSLWPTPMNRGTLNGGSNSRRAAKARGRWLHTPTAKANQASPSMRSRDPGSWFPTPTQSDGLGGPGSSGRDGGDNLRTAVGGQPNPTWVEWIMGFPIGWTDLEPSETP